MADDDAAPSEPREPESTAVEAQSAADTDDAVDAAADGDDLHESEEPAAEGLAAGPSHVRLALIAGLVAVLALGGLTGWLGYRANESRQMDRQRQTFLEVGRQGAINLTTLNYEHIDADVQRILDSATGTFYTQVKSTSAGTVTEAALEAGDTATQAEVLVAVTVKSVIVGQPDQPPRLWRMRILVQKIQDDTKVSNVEFVS
jgi:Mce-associated membrane protein